METNPYVLIFRLYYLKSTIIDLCYATILNIVSLDFINNKDKIYEEKWNNLKEYLKYEINSDGKSSIETETLENVLDMMNLED